MTHKLTGWPAAVVRCGTSPEGLPIGVQVAAAAGRLEDVFGGWQPAPSA
jgi:amidase